MSIAREFVGWDGPCLPRAARWLRQRYGRDGMCDLSRVTVVLPGSRAARRLMELLAAGDGEADGVPSVLVPPALVTAGALPERLYEADVPVLDAWPALLARLAALRDAPRDDLKPLLPEPPAKDDLPGWLRLARELAALDEALAGENVTFEQAIEACRADPDFNDEPRWAAIAALQQRYADLLAAHGVTDRHTARRRAIDAKQCRADGEVVLIGATDLNRVTNAMLSQIENHVTALVFAPQSEAAGFDEFGCLRPEKWCDRRIDVPDERIRIVDAARDQAFEVLRIIGDGTRDRDEQNRPTLGGKYAADEVTIGVGDETLTGLIERTLSLAGLPSHAAIGRPSQLSRPAMLLRAAAEYARRDRLDAFAALLRHPDVEAHLLNVLPPAFKVSAKKRNASREADAAENHEAIADNHAAETANLSNDSASPREAAHSSPAENSTSRRRAGKSKTDAPLPLFAQFIDSDDVSDPSVAAGESSTRRVTATQSNADANGAVGQASRLSSRANGDTYKEDNDDRRDACPTEELTEEPASDDETTDTPAAVIHHWLTLLDNYITDHLAGRTPEHWLGDWWRAKRLKQVRDAVRRLLPADAQTKRPLPQWADAIADLLRRAYAHRTFDIDQPADAQLIRAVRLINDALREQSPTQNADANQPSPWSPAVTFAEAVDLLLARLAEQVLPQDKDSPDAAIEMLGWLELPLDDAPALIVTGFNEHHIPQSGGADALLPDALRRRLGLMDNRRRLARDAAALQTILHSRPFVTLVAARRGADGEPLPPSRLLLTGDGDELARRIEAFYPNEPADEQPGDPLLLLKPGERSRFLIPPPKPPDEPLTKLYVTAFRVYLECPYRFYLRFVERLESLDDRTVEIDGRRFGTLAHRVLQRFDTSDLKHSKNAKRIAAFLGEQLDELASVEYGDEHPGIAQIQVAHLRKRLDRFAQWQAKQAAAGWRVIETELPLTATIDVDSQPFTIEGRIDRVDRHEKTGAIRIIDYKTGDKSQSPQDTHNTNRGKEWVDLQLPLYELLWRRGTRRDARDSNSKDANTHESNAQKSDAPTNDTRDTDAVIELGYVRLPKDLNQVGFVAGEWDAAQLRAAHETACTVIRSIRAGRFWPPRDAAAYQDDYAALCMEQHIDRPAMLAATARLIDRTSPDRQGGV